jgi:hypothetical protein
MKMQYGQWKVSNRPSIWSLTAWILDLWAVYDAKTLKVLLHSSQDS